LQHSFRKGTHAVVRDIVRTATREDRMGFMDKAKKLAEQAQEKLDEAQKNFNKSDSPQAPAEQSVKYDEHGRPIQEETPAAATAPPSATPPADPVGGSPPAEAPAEEAAPPAPPSEDKPASGGADATPDPFKPIE
jgi:hypothetical protein